MHHGSLALPCLWNLASGGKDNVIESFTSDYEPPTRHGTLEPLNSGRAMFHTP